MSTKATVIACVNQKGGTGKTTTCENLGAGLVMNGKKVLLVDFDPQASLSISLGYPKPEELPVTIADMMKKVVDEKEIKPGEGILHHEEGMDLMPSSIELSGMEVALVNTISRETVLKEYLESVKRDYDFVLLDCSPSLGMLTINAMAAADTLLIPVQASYLPAKGLEQLLQTVNKVRRQINPRLKIEGILLTMVDARTNDAKEISELIRNAYGGKIKVYDTEIPRSVRASEISKEGTSIFKHDPGGKVADAYRELTREVVKNAEKRRKRNLEQLR
jgi:chromosome partitioning protein